MVPIGLDVKEIVSDIEIRNHFIVSAIELGKSLSKLIISITCLRSLAVKQLLRALKSST